MNCVTVALAVGADFVPPIVAVAVASVTVSTGSIRGSAQRLFKFSLSVLVRGNSLDELRDTQVMLAEFTETVENLPQLTPLMKYLKKREKRLLEAAERNVQDFKLNSVARKIEKVRAHLAEPKAEQDLSPRLLGSNRRPAESAGLGHRG